MSDPALGLTMLGLIVVAIMMGFPTAFTLMGLGMIFGYIAFWAPGQHWYDNRIFDLIVQRTYGVMTNDTLLSVPLFVFMGYIMERAALVDRMFHSVQLAFRRVPASLAVTTLLVCAFWGIASGIVGAVVVLMGVIALRPMLNAGYDVRLAAGAITAGGTLGILIPPSVMLIVYAAVAGQSIVKLYAAAMLPGFFLTFLYLIYILGWALINPKIAPKLSPDQYRINVPPWLQKLEHGPTRRVIGGLLLAALRPNLVQGEIMRDGRKLGYSGIVKNLLVAAVPVALTVGIFATAWWYITIHNAQTPAPVTAAAPAQLAPTPQPATQVPAEDKPQELGEAESEVRGTGGATRRRSAARGDDDTGGIDSPIHGRQNLRTFLSVVLGIGCAIRPHSAHLLPAHGWRAVRDPQGTVRVGGAAGSAHSRGARGDPVWYLHRHRIGGSGCSGCDVPGGHGEIPTQLLVVESRRRDRRRGARLGAR